MKFTCIIIALLFLMGCSSNNVIIHYDNTNPVKIEEATQGLEITNVLPKAKKINGTIALRSLEVEALKSHLDDGVIYMIEDNLISSLIKNNYRVVERDPEGLSNLYRESTDNYRTYNEQYGEGSNLNSDEVTVTINGETIVKKTDSNSANIKNKFYENEFFETYLSSSDYILSYRVLECGVVYNDYESKDSDNSAVSKFSSTTTDMMKVERSARTRLHLRLTNSKTSEIIAAGILENEITDIIDKDDLEDLKQISYNYYHHTLPLQSHLAPYGYNEDTGYGTTDKNPKVEKAKKTPPKKEHTKVLGILGGVVFFLFAINS